MRVAIARITEQPHDSTRFDFIPHNFEGPTVSYFTIDNGETFDHVTSGAEETNPEIVAHFRALLAAWKRGFDKDLSIRAA